MEPGTPGAEAAPAERAMSAFDAWLFRGDRNPRTRSLLVVVCRLESPPDPADWLHALDRASRLVPRLRQRVVDPPLPLVLPAWIVDPDFELESHAHRVRLPAPGSDAQLVDFAARETARRLDESRPLWEATLVEGLADGSAAVVLKISHAFADGVGAIELFRTLFDATAEARAGELPPVPVPEDVTPDEWLAEQLRRTPHAALEFGRTTARDALDFARSALADPRGALARAGRLVGTGRAFAAGRIPPSPLLRGRSLARRCLAFDVPLAALKSAAAAAGGSLNDAYLAGLVGALREYHVALGCDADVLPLAMPLNLRRGGEAATGNHFGAALLAAPLAIDDARERLERLRSLVLAARADPATALPSLAAPVLARLPDAVRDRLAEGASPPDVQASNVAGSPVPLWFAGRRVLATHAFGPLPGVALMATLQSYAGQCHVGITYDPAAIAKPRAFADALEAGFGAVLALGDGGAITPPVLGRPGRRQAAA